MPIGIQPITSTWTETFILDSGLGPAWEANDRMPAIVRWKGGGVPEGETSSEMVSALDVLPTVLSMIGKDIPIGIEVDGIDVTDVFLGQAQSSSSSLLLQNEGKVWWLQFQYNVYNYRMAVKSMMRHVLLTPAVSNVLLCDVIGRMSGLQDTDTSPWVYIIIKW